MEFYYTISKENLVQIFGQGESEPFIIQPYPPGENEWSSEAEAIAWAEESITLMRENAKELTPEPEVTEEETNA